jgi:hypothetical protein
MKKNMGNIDRIIRIIAAIIFVALYYTENITGALGIALIILSVVFVATSFVSFCPLYSIFGLNTCPTKQNP